MYRMKKDIILILFYKMLFQLLGSEGDRIGRQVGDKLCGNRRGDSTVMLTWGPVNTSLLIRGSKREIG